jgi:sulfoxide reductase heme-binding subunit YedZ
MFNPTQRQFKVIKACLFVVCLLPFVRLLTFALSNRLGANPLEFITRNTGDWTLYFLCITLCVTPFRRFSGWNWAIRLRRMLGLYAFFYIVLHFATFIWFDHFFDLEEMATDIVKRPFILVGFLSFLLLVPLAVTSTDGWRKRLGVKRWLQLHKLLYLIAPLGILHFWWMKAGKHNFEQPIIFGTIVAVLLLLRMTWAMQQRQQRRRATMQPR